jgi:hypothetical protein
MARIRSQRDSNARFELETGIVPGRCSRSRVALARRTSRRICQRAMRAGALFVAGRVTAGFPRLVKRRSGDRRAISPRITVDHVVLIRTEGSTAERHTRAIADDDVIAEP